MVSTLTPATHISLSETSPQACPSLTPARWRIFSVTRAQESQEGSSYWTGTFRQSSIRAVTISPHWVHSICPVPCLSCPQARQDGCRGQAWACLQSSLFSVTVKQLQLHKGGVAGEMIALQWAAGSSPGGRCCALVLGTAASEVTSCHQPTLELNCKCSN